MARARHSHLKTKAVCSAKLWDNRFVLRLCRRKCLTGSAGWISPLGLVSSAIRDRMEFLRIAKFYATESMLCWDAAANRYDAEATPEFGSDTLQEFYKRLASGEALPPERGEHSLF